MHVRPATPDDAEIIGEFNHRLAAESEGKQLDRATLAKGVRAALHSPGRLLYWLAERDAVPIGQAAISTEWSDWRNGWIWWLQSVYVDPEHRRSGVLSAILKEIESTARNNGDVVGLRLYVEKSNHTAQISYRALGFAPGGYDVFEKRLSP